jgi:hypothetical protein
MRGHRIGRLHVILHRVVGGGVALGTNLERAELHAFDVLAFERNAALEPRRTELACQVEQGLHRQRSGSGFKAKQPESSSF